MTQQYDETDSGAAFPPKDNTKLILTGPINDNGNDTRIAVVKSTLPDGRQIFDLFEKVGTLFDNEAENPKAPNYTGPWGNRRIAAWAKESDNGQRYMSMKISDKRDQMAVSEAPMPANSQVSEPVDDIPF